MSKPTSKLPPADKVSAETRRLNPHLYGQTPYPAPVEKVHGAGDPPQKTIRRRRRVMNQTETEYSMMLQAQVERGEILSWSFEGITLRWGREEIFTYTPDFVVFVKVQFGHEEILTRIRLIEVKGAHIFGDAIQRFKQARDAHPHFEFEFHQRMKGGVWNQLA